MKDIIIKLSDFDKEQEMFIYNDKYEVDKFIDFTKWVNYNLNAFSDKNSPYEVVGLNKSWNEDLDKYVQNYLEGGTGVRPLAEQMMKLRDEILAFNSPSPASGKISIGVINSALIDVLPPILQKIKIESPGLDIRIMAGISPSLFSQVGDGVLDAAIITKPPISITTDLIIRPLYTDTFLLIMAKNMPYSQLAKVLESQPYIAFDRSTWVGQKVEGFLQKLSIKAHVAMELDSQDAIISLIKHGIGVSIMPIRPNSDSMCDPHLQFISISGLSLFIRSIMTEQYSKQRISIYSNKI